VSTRLDVACWMGFVPAITTYPGGKVIVAVAVLVHVPVWQVAPMKSAVPALPCTVKPSDFMVVPFRARLSENLIAVTLLVQSTLAKASTSLMLVVTKGAAELIVQSIVLGPLPPSVLLSSTLAVFERRVAVESLVIAPGIRGGLDPIESFPDWIRGADAGGCRTA